MKDNYSSFSQVYDQLFDKSLYQDWLHYTRLALGQQGVDPDQENLRVLDLACGDGELICLFLQEGWQVSGLDRSEDMLDLAVDKTNEYGDLVPFYLADMRNFELSESFQLITCYCDSLNYLAGSDEVAACFRSVYQALDPGGVFLFDVLSEDKVNRVFPDFQWVQEWDDAVFTWRSEQVRGRNTIDHLLNLFVENEDGLYTREEERHCETVLSLDQYQDLLDRTGFKQVKVSGNYDLSPAAANSERIFFSCRK